MQTNGIQRRYMKLKYKLLLAFTILVTITTVVLGIISYMTDEKYEILKAVIIYFSLITAILNIILSLCCIDSDNIYNYETLQVRESASI